MQLRKNNKGQILVEYLLLMVIAVGLATFMTKALIGRGETNPDENGIIIRAWHGIIQIIGNDIPDCANQTNYLTNNCPP